tara:strand:- start:265 stop:984 length:720 start_codon:yes stop_codon:yes gene_type:complete
VKNKILIATATYNEFENISKLIQNILDLKLSLHILVVDDKSPDKTYLILNKFKKKIPKKFDFILRKGKLGLDTAHKEIYKYANRKKFDYLITMDADLSHNPSRIKHIIKYLDKYDFVIGSRYIKGGRCNMKIRRRLLSKYGNFFIGLILNSKIQEHTTSFRGFNLKKLKIKNFDFELIKSKGYSFFMETIFHLRKKNCSIKEIPIIFNDRENGVSKISKFELFITLYNLFYLKLIDIFK